MPPEIWLVNQKPCYRPQCEVARFWKFWKLIKSRNTENLRSLGWKLLILQPFKIKFFQLSQNSRKFCIFSTFWFQTLKLHKKLWFWLEIYVFKFYVYITPKGIYQTSFIIFTLISWFPEPSKVRRAHCNPLGHWKFKKCRYR